MKKDLKLDVTKLRELTPTDAAQVNGGKAACVLCTGTHITQVK